MEKTAFVERVKRFARLVYLKFFRINDSPLRIALGFGLGAFTGVMPGVGPVAALALAFLFKVNRASALLGSVLFNTWLSLLALLFAIKAGAWVTGRDYDVVRTAWTGIFTDFKWKKFFQVSIVDVLVPVGVGFLVVALFFSAVATVVVYWSVLYIRKQKSFNERNGHDG